VRRILSPAVSVLVVAIAQMQSSVAFAQGSPGPSPELIVAGRGIASHLADSADILTQWRLRATSRAQLDSLEARVAAFFAALGQRFGSGISIERSTWPASGSSLFPRHTDTLHFAHGSATVVVRGTNVVAAALMEIDSSRLFTNVRANYGCTCADSLADAALVSASRDARRRATLLAAASGLQLADLLQVSSEPIEASSSPWSRGLPSGSGFVDEINVSTGPATVPSVSRSQTIWMRWQVRHK
jgi:uncharacterized protein YggE